MSIITKLKLSITPSAKALQASDSEGAFTKQAAAAFVGHADTKVTERYVMPGLKLAVPEAELWA